LSQIAIAAFDIGFVLAACIVTAACGWWAVAPLRDCFRFPAAVAGAAGLLLLPTCTMTLTVLLGWPLQRSGPASVVMLGALSAANLWRVRHELDRRMIAWSALAAACATLLAVAGLMPDEIRAGEPALAYMYGTDHLGYAHAADWLRERLQPPGLALDPTDPYPSYVDYLFRYDPRAGSFTLAALVSIASGRSGMFSYDLLCATVLAIGAAGIAGAFARGRASLMVLTVALAASTLYDQAQTGFFGKLCGGFALLLTARLAIARYESAAASAGGNSALLAIASVAAGAGVMYSGVLAAVFVMATAGTYVIWQALAEPGQPQATRVAAAWNRLLFVALIAGIAFMASGVVARPYIVGWGPYPIGWGSLLASATGIESGIGGIAAWRADWILPATIVALVACALIAGLALQRGAKLGGAFVLGTLLLGTIVAVAGRWTFAQVFAFLPLGVMCGAVALCCHLVPQGGWPVRALAAGATAVLIALQGPRVVGAVRHYAFIDLPELRFVRSDADALAAAITACGGAYVDLDWHSHMSIYVLNEMSWRGVPGLQWGPRSWNPLVAYRRWPVPTYEHLAPLRIVKRGDAGPPGSTLVVRTRQLDAIRVPGPATAACGPS
jgi:hypothetical protein